MNDFRYAFRQLLKNPGFTAVAMFTLALGIGVNTAIFSMVNAVILRPPPYSDPDRLVQITVARKDPRGFDFLGHLEILAWQKHNPVLSHLGVYHAQDWNLTGGDESERVTVADVSSGFLPALGVQPALGRVFSPEEDKPGGSPLAILTYRLWQRRFGGDTNVLGKTITIDLRAYTIIGVLPSSFQPPAKYYSYNGQWDLFRPLGLDEKGHGYLNALGRLKPGVSLAQATASLDILYQQFRDPEDPEGKVVLLRLQDYLPVKTRGSLLLYQGAVGFVLLIACVNVANLLLARGGRRRKEIAVRVALGAGRLRIIRQLLTESVLLALLGSVLGLLLASAITNAVRSLLPDLKEVSWIRIDGRVFTFTLVVASLTGLICGLAPALEASRVSLNESLKEGGRNLTGGLQQHRLRSVLVIAEVALALVLLVGAGLLIECFFRFRGVDPGFRADRLLTMSISVSWSKYPNAPKWTAYYQKVIEELRSLPGVEAVGADLAMPFAYPAQMRATVEVDGRTNEVVLGIVNPDYFRALGIPVKRGRCFTDQDRAGAPPVVMVNESLVRLCLPPGDPIGQRIRSEYHYGGNLADDWKTVVGVVGDVRVQTLTQEADPRLYLCYLQHGNDEMGLALRTWGNPMALAAPARARIRGVDPDQVVRNIMTMEQCLSASLIPQRTNMWLASTLGVLALVLAMVGIYGVMSFLVAQQTHEIGVRTALGAQRVDTVRMVVREGMGLAILGVLIGLIGALASTRVLSSSLYGIKPTDPLTFVCVSLLLLGVALLACWLPARRAAKVDPMEALRAE
jgi:predicted permease